MVQSSLVVFSLLTQIQDLGWDPPRPDVTDTAPFSTDLKVLLDDVDNELQVLMSKQPDEEKRQLKLHFSFTPATKEIQSLLGCDDCMLSFHVLVRMLSTNR